MVKTEENNKAYHAKQTTRVTLTTNYYWKSQQYLYKSQQSKLSHHNQHMKFTIEVFGCQMNYADAARIKTILKSCWHQYTTNQEESDIIIFDTCSIKQKSEDKITGRLTKITSNQKIRITGCMVQHNLRHSKISKKLQNKTIHWLMKKWNFIGNIKTRKPTITWRNNSDIQNLNKEWDYIFVNHAFNPFFYNLQKTFHNLELVLRIDDIGFLPIILPQLWYPTNNNKVFNEYADIIPDFHSNQTTQQASKPKNNTNPSTAYIPISTGCNQFCSYCIVPYARWLEKNYPISQIVQEARLQIQNWAQEIYLIGQIVNKHPQFNQIIKEILQIPWLKRLRYTSPYPTFYNDELFTLHQNEPKLCPHIHIPVQSGSNSILKKMFRWYTVGEFKSFINKIHNLSRPISITTDIIVGFCSETEKDFQESLALVAYCHFDMIYIGIYSTRPGTYAATKYQDNIPYTTKHDRRNRLNNSLKQTSAQNNKKELNQKKLILIDQISTKNTNNYVLTGHTSRMKTVEIQTKNSRHKKWDFVEVEIISTQSLKLYWKEII